MLSVIEIMMSHVKRYQNHGVICQVLSKSWCHMLSVIKIMVSHVKRYQNHGAKC